MALVRQHRWPSPCYLPAYLLLALGLGTLAGPLPIEASVRRSDTRPVSTLPTNKFPLNYPDPHAAIDQPAGSNLSAGPHSSTRPKRRVTAPQLGHYLRLRSRAEPGQDFCTSV